MVIAYGMGVAIIGRRRDTDPETASYVKTLAVMIFWVIPVFMLRAYRVQEVGFGLGFAKLDLAAAHDDHAAIALLCEAKNGWHFIGREPLSQLARTWNLIFLVLFALWISRISIQ
jgi:hypothetical protein